MFMFLQLECCGVKNYQDWQDLDLGPAIPTPISCCRGEHRMRECSRHVRFDHPAEANKLIYVQVSFQFAINLALALNLIPSILLREFASFNFSIFNSFILSGLLARTSFRNSWSDRGSELLLDTHSGHYGFRLLRRLLFKRCEERG